MKRLHRHAALMALGLTLMVSTIPIHAASRSAAPAGIQLGAGSALWIEGTSNIHDWESRSTQVSVVLTRDSLASAPRSASDIEAMVRGAHISGLTLEVPVVTLKSTKSGLDKNLWKDLQSDAHPVIRFTLDDYSVLTREAGRDTTELKAKGRLTIAGQERPVTVAGRVYRSDGGLWLDGRHAMRMTDFGIKPRTMMMGTLRVRDEITVHYHLLLTPKKD